MNSDATVGVSGAADGTSPVFVVSIATDMLLYCRHGHCMGPADQTQSASPPLPPLSCCRSVFAAVGRVCAQCGRRYDVYVICATCFRSDRHVQYAWWICAHTGRRCARRPRERHSAASRRTAVWPLLAAATAPCMSFTCSGVRSWRSCPPIPAPPFCLWP